MYEAHSLRGLCMIIRIVSSSAGDFLFIKKFCDSVQLTDNNKILFHDSSLVGYWKHDFRALHAESHSKFDKAAACKFGGNLFDGLEIFWISQIAHAILFQQLSFFLRMLDDL